MSISDEDVVLLGIPRQQAVDEYVVAIEARIDKVTAKKG